MANQYVKFAVRYVLPIEVCAWIKRTLELIDLLTEKGLRLDDAEGPEDHLAFAMKMARSHACESGCDLEVNQFPGSNFAALRITAMERGEYVMVAEVIQEAMIRFNLSVPLTFCWAETCDLPKPGEFGGGAVLITPNKLVWASTSNWAEKVERAYTENPEMIDEVQHYSPETFLALLRLCRELTDGSMAPRDIDWARNQLHRILMESPKYNVR